MNLTRLLFLAASGVPAYALTLGGTFAAGASAPLVPPAKTDCGCEIGNDPRPAPSAPSAPVASPARIRGTLPRCKDTLCFGWTYESSYPEFFCEPGGIWRTCETAFGDNDGDGLSGEAHFWNVRYVDTYRCPNGAAMRICTAWNTWKVNGLSGQDNCCYVPSTPPPCPQGSCRE